MLKVSFFTLALFAFSNAYGQALTMDDALREAKLHSPRLQRAEASAGEADWRRVEAYSGFLPNISAVATHYFEQKYVFTDLDFGGAPVSVPGIVPTSSLGLSASLPLFDGFQNVNHYAAARASSEAARLDADWLRFQVEEDIRLKFFQALAAEKLAAVADENVKTIQDHLKNTQLLKRGGVSTQYDVLRTEVQLSEAESDRIHAQDDVVITRQALSEALGVEADKRKITGDLPEPQTGGIDHLEFPNLESRADLRALESRERAAMKNSSASAAAYWVPRVSLIGTYTYYNNLTTSAWDNDHYRNAYQFGIQLAWNLFDGMASYARSREAELQDEQAAKTLKIAQLKLPSDFETWKRRYNYSTSLYRSKSVSVDKAQESVRLAIAGYRAGIRINSEVLDSELELFRARAGVVSAQLSAVEALINLELATGQKIASTNR